MNKGITFFFGFDVEPRARAEMIKAAGFTSVITVADPKFDCENGDIASQVAIFRDTGLELSSLHMRYDSGEELTAFWREGAEGDRIRDRMLLDLEIAKKYGFTCLVVHLVGEYSSVGEGRMQKILRECEDIGLPLAVENLTDRQIILDVSSRLSSPMLGYCYDAGHNNCFDRGFDYLALFGDKLRALHLHDNDGTADQHTLTKYRGSIDWDKIAFSLAKVPDISLDYELFNRIGAKTTAKDFLADAYIQATALEQKILKYKEK